MVKRNNRNQDNEDIFTICTECKYLIEREKISPKGFFANNFDFCGAIIRKKERDPYDGKRKYVSYDLFGGKFYTDQKHPYSRDINTDGKCPYHSDKLHPLDKSRKKRNVIYYEFKPIISDIPEDSVVLDFPIRKRRMSL